MIKITPWKKVFVSALMLSFLSTAAPVWAGEEGVVEDRNVIVTGSIVNVRNGADTTFAKLGQVKKGDQLAVVNEKNGWYLVDVPNLGQAWIAGWLVEEKKDSGQSQQEPSQNNPATIPAALVVASDIVNIRSGPNLDSNIVAQVFINQKYPILAQEGAWYKIRVGSTEGWIAGWLAGIEVSTLPITSKIVTVTSNVVNIRQGASLSSIVIGKVYRGQHMAVIGRQGDWYQVRTSGGQQGWIATWLTEPLPGSAPARGENSQAATPGNLKGKLIVLDPGHASEQPGNWLDPGAIGPRTGTYEREINMSIAAKLKRMLEDAGAKVILTHNGSTSLSLAGRAATANNISAAIFVSIHANSSTNKDLAGHTTYFYAPWNNTYLRSQRTAREKLATLVQKELVKAGGRRDVGVREANYAVLRETTIPSILVETAFLSHSEEEMLLLQDTYRELLARGIFTGIQAYFQ